MFPADIIDIIALSWFLLCWIAYAWVADRQQFGSASLMRATYNYRKVWMQRMLDRDNRIVDSTLIASLMGSVSFFASATIIIIGGLIAVMGATEQAIAITAELPFAVRTSRKVWELKLLLLLVIFIYAFFKFTWSLRQFNYCCIMVGAAPLDFAHKEDRDAYACHAARLNSLAGNHFNRGLRAYYFGLAVLAWFIHPWLFMAVSAWVVVVLYRREFVSDILKILGECEGLVARGGADPKR